MPHAKRLQGVATAMQRVVDEVRSNAVAAEDALAEVEDRERRRTERTMANAPAALARDGRRG
jgi:hypothetical protein